MVGDKEFGFFNLFLNSRIEILTVTDLCFKRVRLKVIKTKLVVDRDKPVNSVLDWV